MRIVSKTYVLIAVLIAVAAVNLFLLYEIQQESADESFSIIRTGDLKVKVETISSLTNSISSGNEQDRINLENEINDFDYKVNTLKNGGMIGSNLVSPIHPSLIPDYNYVYDSWQTYKQDAKIIQETKTFNENAVSAVNYLLEKNSELVLLTDSLIKDLEVLDRTYKTHKEIAGELHDLAIIIGQNALLVSIGNEQDVNEKFKYDRLRFDIGLKKLLQIPNSQFDLLMVNEQEETLIEIPRENANSLRTLDPLWESIRLRIMTLENESVYSEEFAAALSNLNMQRAVLLDSLDALLDKSNGRLQDNRTQRQSIVQALIGVDIAVFVAVVVVIRQSLNPLESITAALSRVKEGVYGEKIQYNASDEVGELVSTFNIMSDTIKEKEEQAKQTDLAKDEFLAMITHELKTPLVPIQGYADLLLKEHLGKLTVKQKERLAIIKESSDSLLQLISDLLDVQKLELGQLRMRRDNQSILSTIQRAEEIMMPQAQSNGVKLTFSGNDIVIPHDQERVVQVITNLIKNSLNAVEKNTGKVEITLENLGSEIKVSVTDNGRGIPQEKQEQLFKKFYQIDATLTREHGGSGLGLAICKGIIDWHGGQIGLSSTSGKGSTFWFTLPINAPGTTAI